MRAGNLGNKKGRQSKLPARKENQETYSDVWLGLAQTLHAIAALPLSALFEEIDALEALQDVTFNDEAVGPLETLML